MNMMIAGMIFGAAFLLYGIYSVISGHTLLFGINGKHFTERSVRLFARLSGAMKLLAGAGIILYTLGTNTSIPIVISWISASIVWISFAAIVTMYMTILVRK